MLGYQVEYSLNGVMSVETVFAYGVESARYKVVTKFPGCAVYLIMPYVPRRSR
jgi:hypothetical protein